MCQGCPEAPETLWAVGVILSSLPIALLDDPMTLLDRPITLWSRRTTPRGFPITLLNDPATLLNRPTTHLNDPATLLDRPITLLNDPTTLLGVPATDFGSPAAPSASPAAPWCFQLVPLAVQLRLPALRRLLARDQAELFRPPADLVGLAGLLEAEALLAPGIAVGVVAVLLPEAAAVLGQELDAVHPLAALPGVEMGDDQAQRPAVVAGEVPAVPGVDEERSSREEVLERQVGRVAAVAVDHHVRGVRKHARLREKIAGREALPKVVEGREAGHAVKIGGDACPRQRLELEPAELDLLFDPPEEAQAPVGGLGVRHRAVGQDRPLVRHVLAGRHAIVAGVGDVVQSRSP